LSGPDGSPLVGLWFNETHAYCGNGGMSQSPSPPPVDASDVRKDGPRRRAFLSATYDGYRCDKGAIQFPLHQVFPQLSYPVSFSPQRPERVRTGNRRKFSRTQGRPEATSNDKAHDPHHASFIFKLRSPSDKFEPSGEVYRVPTRGRRQKCKIACRPWPTQTGVKHCGP
jgi:hypothetical protein